MSVTEKLDALERVLEASTKDIESLKQVVEQGTREVESLKEEVFTLKKENFDIRRDLFIAQKENSKLKKMDQVEQQTESIERRMEERRQNLTHVQLKASGGLVTDRFVKLNKCLDFKLVNDGRVSDAMRWSGCVVALKDGDFSVGARIVQHGEGQLGLFVNWDGNTEDEGQWLARTVAHWDVRAGGALVRLKKGQRLWLEVKRWSNDDASIWRCDLFCWML